MHCELSAKWYQHCDMELDLYIVSCPHQNYKTPSQKKIKKIKKIPKYYGQRQH